MLKALLKKQLLEVFGRSSGKKKLSFTEKPAGRVLVMAAVFGLVAVGIGAMCVELLSVFLASGMEWLYFSLVGTMSVALGIFGSVFSTYAQMYLARDNDLLLSMPIPPGTILLARMTGTWIVGLIYEAMALIPAMVVYVIRAGIDAKRLLLFAAGVLGTSFLVLAFTCLFGWVVALISVRLKNKSAVTVIFSLLLITAYYMLVGNAENLIESMAANMGILAQKMNGVLYPMVLLGCGCAGNGSDMLLYVLLSVALAALAWLILSRTFLKLATKNSGTAAKAYRRQAVKPVSPDRALLRREWGRFGSSAVYMLNCGLGTVMMPAGAVAALILLPKYRPLLAVLPIPDGVLAVIAAAAVCLISAMNNTTSPSVSLEGQNLWITQSLPVEPYRVLKAKLRLHLLLTLPPMLLLIAVLGFELRLSVPEILASALLCTAFVNAFARLGLVLNLKHCNLNWTNETVPIKQSMSVGITLLGGLAAAAAIGAVGFALAGKVPSWVLLLGLSLLPAIPALLMEKWLRTKGAERYSEL